ncbi:hypothetical protein DYBT9623_00678 [Dyadobacter sp. CECT 9623]|uniref:Uncharacterized protein n=1 Tax=Dyadobacter linearis TaxID=2823330 RepID=A0ABN7R1B5_9BACT|nr:hypothetical protein [Dyadobacter sp. CECT 9623]CAG5067950.1 hypothetical protein DYBT9623_00678 [Dyadobacter sp. CECT 9623]
MKNALEVNRNEECNQSKANEAMEAINEFFSSVGSAKRIEGTLWYMLQASITNPNDPTDDQDNAERCYLYRRLKEFLEAIEPAKYSSENGN